MSLSVEEKVRVAHVLDDLGIPFIEAGFPASNPKEAELFERLEHERLRADVCAFGMTRRRDVARRRGPGAARARRVVRAGLHAGRQDLEPAPREGRQGRPRREPGDDRRVGRVPGRAGQARDLRRRALLRRLARRPGLRARLPARRGRGGRRERHAVRHQRRLAARTQVAEAVRDVVAAPPDAPIGIHCHNDAECGVANSLAAVAEGAVLVQGTMNGYGERCGNANLTSIVPACSSSSATTACRRSRAGPRPRTTSTSCST